MEKTIITSGKTIDLAVEAALAQLGLERDDITYQVLALPKAGFLGVGAQPAKVIVTYEVPDPVVTEPAAPKSALGSASRSKSKAAAAKEYAAKRGIVEDEEEENCMSGIPSRPYCKGRNYDPNRYASNSTEE